MRTVLAILALVPAISFAQSKSPAQPQSTPVLQSSLAAPTSMSEVNFAARTTVASPLRVIAGVTAPRLLTPMTTIVSDSPDFLGGPRERSVVVSFTIDTHGVPQNVGLVASSDPLLNRSAIAAVQQLRYTPAVMNGNSIAYPTKLTINVQ